jgi:hypothetical protein
LEEGTATVGEAASPVLAEEVLYCVDTEMVGFAWDKAGQARQARFKPDRFTVKLVSDTERIITRMVGHTAGSSRTYTQFF